MARLEKITQQRLEKLKRIQDQGLNPYPNTCQRSHTAIEAIALFEQHQHDPEILKTMELSLAGRIMANRFMGKVAFLDIRDVSGKIQLFISRDSVGPEKYELLRELDIGDIIGVSGTLFRTKTEEITLRVDDYTLLSKALHSLPEKWHGLVDVEKRYRQRYLDLISNEDIRVLFERRSQIIKALRDFLNERGFIEVETPVLQGLAGGAMARPFITHHHALDEDLYLRIALELYLKRLIIGGFEKVYEIGRVFRNEGISVKHNPEFTMLESYQAYADYHTTMELVEQMTSFVATSVIGSTEIKYGNYTIDFKPPWKRIPLREAIQQKCGIDFEEYPDATSLRTKMEQMGMHVDPSKEKGRLIDELISTYVEPDLIQPTFLIDYPIEMSPLAKRKPDQETLVERFEAFIGSLEIANSFTELNNPLEQRERFQYQVEEREIDRDEKEVIDDDFLLAMEYGMPPTGGLGIGIDRLVMLLTDQQSIREVILFPQLKTK